MTYLTTSTVGESPICLALGGIFQANFHCIHELSQVEQFKLEKIGALSIQEIHMSERKLDPNRPPTS